jgi:hypothetical protein
LPGIHQYQSLGDTIGQYLGSELCGGIAATRDLHVFISGQIYPRSEMSVALDRRFVDTRDEMGAAVTDRFKYEATVAS